MTGEIRKRLEEAAERAGIKAFNNAYDNLETGEVCILCQEVAYNYYWAGAKLGYKEAIAEAMRWIADICEKVGFSNKTISQCVESFESNMNKFWEGEK